MCAKTVSFTRKRTLRGEHTDVFFCSRMQEVQRSMTWHSCNSTFLCIAMQYIEIICIIYFLFEESFLLIYLFFWLSFNDIDFLIIYFGTGSPRLFN